MSTVVYYRVVLECLDKANTMPRDKVLLVKYFVLFMLIQGSCSIDMTQYQLYLIAEEDFVPVTIKVVKRFAWCVTLFERDSAMGSSSSSSNSLTIQVWCAALEALTSRWTKPAKRRVSQSGLKGESMVRKLHRISQ